MRDCESSAAERGLSTNSGEGIDIEMPKQKIKGTVKKRLALTATGKLKRRRAYHSHILTKKNAKRKRRLRTTTVVAGADQRRLRRLLGV
jgi:large subunit ribosomal protein L35